MLEGIEPKITHFGCIRMAERAKKTAGFAGFVVTDRVPGRPVSDGFMVICLAGDGGWARG
jgi:hypothetical protein